MDVSGWTIDQRMRFPDYCFGNKDLISTFVWNPDDSSFKWNIGAQALPDPCCIWQLLIMTSLEPGADAYMRFGLCDTCPTTEAQMDNALELFADLGVVQPGPNKITLWGQPFVFWAFDCRRGMVTGGKKLTMEMYCYTAVARAMVILNVSELPTEMAGWMAHAKV